MEFGILQNFNNREIAIGIWVAIFGFWAFYKKEIREAFTKVVKAFFAWKLTISYLAMFLYVSFVVSAMYSIGIWDPSLVISTLLWVALGAFSMLFNHQRANDNNFFIVAIKEHLKILLFLEFLINFYVFNLWAELVLVPVLIIIGAMLAISETKEEYEPARKLLTFLSSSIGAILLIYVGYMAFDDFSNFATLQNLRSFVVPILLSLSFLLFVYFAALAINYETLFVRLSFFAKEKPVLSYAKKKILLTCGINLKKLNKWSEEMNHHHFDSTESVDSALYCFNKAP